MSTKWSVTKVALESNREWQSSINCAWAMEYPYREKNSVCYFTPNIKYCKNKCEGKTIKLQQDNKGE